MTPARVLVLLALGPALSGCRTEAPGLAEGVAARVGTAVLSEAEVARAVAAAPAGADSAEARRAVVGPWVRRELLAQSARADGLADEPGVRARLAEAERAVLESAALDHHLASAAPSEADVAAYYARHRARFALQAPSVRVRHLHVRGAAGGARAIAAAEALGRVAASGRPDSTFALAAREFSSDPAGAVALAAAFVPEATLAATDAALGRAVAGLAPGPRVVVVPSGSSVHVVQVAERLPAGAVPPLSAVRGEIAERLGVGVRTDRAARLVERLRAEAEARGALLVR